MESGIRRFGVGEAVAPEVHERLEFAACGANGGTKEKRLSSEQKRCRFLDLALHFTNLAEHVLG